MMSAPRTALLLGASGSVGQAVLASFVACADMDEVIVFVRRRLDPVPATKVTQCVLPEMSPDRLCAAVTEALAGQTREAVGVSVLGVGAGTAKLSLAEHRAIDVDLNAAFARGLRQSGCVPHLLFMSAIGANVNARATGSGAAGMPRYARVKGEAEAAVLAEGPARVSLFRPSVIVGSAHTPRAVALLASLVAPLTPAKWRPIRTTEIAQAMLAVARHPPPTNQIYDYPAMMALQRP